MVRSVLRRSSGASIGILTIGDLTVDFVNHIARRGLQKLDLTPKEFQLLGFLARNLDHTQTREQISAQVWEGISNSGTNVVDVHIRRLRSKVDEPFSVKLIHTVRGTGYMLSVSPPKGDTE